MKMILTLILLFHLACGFSQNRVIEGHVTLFEDLRLSNIVVEAQKTGSQVLTDTLGRFSVVCAPKDRLVFKSETFRTQKVKITPKTGFVEVALVFTERPDMVEMAIGYGYISKDKSAYVQTTLDNRMGDFCSYTDIYELVQGKCPGVMVTNSGGGVGSSKEIIIRGKTSLMSGNSAMLVVDGVQVYSVDHLSPCHVKRIDFLKDAAASIYGSSGANGVVLIETIKGGNQ
ncbi:MAG: TonB-dependent receptor plug domain-containing protein [Prolixibacteraceae bacterium]|nr:TonB-dependent receptor plug domain-containing protein [Prolixibacteraceae bacterium]